MSKGRLEAFSDGVLAIIITIMVLEIKAPASAELSALEPMVPILVSYLLSFIYIGIYWNNHHHMLQASRRVNGVVLWANLHLLFWLSLIPVVTSWMGQSHFASLPVAVYGLVLLLSGGAFVLLNQALIAVHGPDSVLAKAVGRDRKGHLSLLLYAIAVPGAFVQPWIGGAIYALVALIWFVPDRRIESKLAGPDE